MFQAELQYEHYLMEVDQTLKQDPHVSAKMKNFTVENLPCRQAD